MSESRILPAFASEEEEANWWYDNREKHAEEFERAFNEGRVTVGRGKGPNSVRRAIIQIDSKDYARAIPLAEKKGIDPQLYLRGLIHDELDRLLSLEG